VAVKIIEAPHFQEESKAQGATKENIKAAYSIVEAALDGRLDLVDVEIVRATSKEPDYRPWIRLKGKKSIVRIAAERYKDGDDLVILLHTVIPRDEHTYEIIEALWKKHRSKL